MGHYYLYIYWMPLNTLLGFCEDYKRVVVNTRHHLILIRARSDNNCLVGNPTTEPEIDLLSAVANASRYFK